MTVFSILSILCIPVHSLASDLDEFKVKREAVYEFVQKPVVTRLGDRVEIAFETKGLCDVTVAVEDQNGAIVRHIGSGVLGPNAPAPFQKNSKKQTIVWDSKDEHGTYLDNMGQLTVRVSLGLKPQFERSLFWHPKKRIGSGRNPLIVPQPEGVYVYEGDGVEQVKLFDHEGNYLRTVYPFPADKVRQVKGLGWRTHPDGYEAPVHIGFWRSTFLTGGVERTDAGPGSAAKAFTVHNGRIAMLNDQLCRVATDGSTGGLDLYGPTVSQLAPWERTERYRPKSAALSPDGKYLYFTGYYENTEHKAYGAYGPNIYWIHGLYRMEFGKNDPPQLFLGAIDEGRDEKHFFCPSSVTCDAQGRLWVADWGNDRIQVFAPDAKLLKSLPVEGPVIIQIHPKTGEVYVFSWAMPWSRKFPTEPKAVTAVMRRFKSFDEWKVVGAVPLPFDKYTGKSGGGRTDEGQERAAVDFTTDPPTIWLIVPVPPYSGWGIVERGIRLYREEGRALKETGFFSADLKKARIREQPPALQRQRLYVDPRNGTLYVAEADSSVGKAVRQLWKIDPATGRGDPVELPYSMEDMAIDDQGRAYLRTTEIVGRFDMATWQEVPFDYGVDRDTRFAYDARPGHVTGGLLVPSNKPVYWHQSGMGVNPEGDLVISCYNDVAPVRMRDGKQADDPTFKPYTPVLYPGRFRYGEVHVWDKYGKVKRHDALPGVPDGHGTYIDPKGNIYVLVAGTRILDGKDTYGVMAGSVMRFSPGRKGRFVSDSDRCPVPLKDGDRPKGAPVLLAYATGRLWAVNADWMYSGIGFVFPGGPCQCWNCRFHIDTFGRSFAPETQRCQVAVLDPNGNLICHIGRYGNVDDGVPTEPSLSPQPSPARGEGDAASVPPSPPVAGEGRGGVPSPSPPVAGEGRGEGGLRVSRSLGGDEVSLAYACFVATHTDRRLFIADSGNARIVSVKLNYHATENVRLKDVAESK